jgi:hypothetical protein
MPLSNDAVRENGPPMLKLELEQNDEAPSLARAAVLGL